jgi:hypothetical protein
MNKATGYILLTAILISSCLLSCSQASRQTDLSVAEVKVPSTVNADSILEIEITVTNRNTTKTRIYSARLEYDIFGSNIGNINQTQTSTVWAGSTDTIRFVLPLLSVKLSDQIKSFQPYLDITYTDDKLTTSIGKNLGEIIIE